MKNLNQQNFNKMAGKFFKGISAGGALLIGLGLFAMNSYYYGTYLEMQWTSDTTPSNSTNLQESCPPTFTEKASILKSPSLKHPSFIMCKQGKMKSLLKLPTETCKASDYQ